MRQFPLLFAVMAAVGAGVARYSDHAKSGGTNAMAMAASPSRRRRFRPITAPSP
jgi:hypothetical protein